MLSIIQIDAATEVMRIIKCITNRISHRYSSSWSTLQSGHALRRFIRNNFGLRIRSLSNFENIRDWLIIVLLIEFRTFGWCNIRRILRFVLTCIRWLKSPIYICLLLDLSRLIRIHIDQAPKFIIFRLLQSLLSRLAIHCGLRTSSHDERILNMAALGLEGGF